MSAGIGPIFGLFNDLGTPVKSGLSASVKLEYPGVMFVSLRSDRSIGGSLVQVGDYAQELTDITLGICFPNAICTLAWSTQPSRLSIALRAAFPRSASCDAS